ncbi:lipopolysaccharide assembly protein LapA domain-containing protein [Sphingobacterium sp. HMA12]|uniref:lipopolysaccharide assembly protein LapA domain-containing protein n=1 Tax=Sphingobacterium sp. HMA12 TaxID=2050894 RepID=UPI000CE9CD51|nr:lipopolysaccharide assembly protein LapA domain-containing protein [Sphingobacterium sp. HMA12]
MRNILLILLSVIVTLVCVKNSQTVNIDFFVEGKIALWKLLLAFFVMGTIFAFLLRGGKKKQRQESTAIFDQSEENNEEPKSKLSDEDRDFLS